MRLQSDSVECLHWAQQSRATSSETRALIISDVAPVLTQEAAPDQPISFR